MRSSFSRTRCSRKRSTWRSRKTKKKAYHFSVVSKNFSLKDAVYYCFILFFSNVSFLHPKGRVGYFHFTRQLLLSNDRCSSFMSTIVNRLQPLPPPFRYRQTVGWLLIKSKVLVEGNHSHTLRALVHKNFESSISAIPLALSCVSYALRRVD